MSGSDQTKVGASRRGFLAAAGGVIASAGVINTSARADASPPAPDARVTEPFFGAHQGGIITPTQSHTYFAAFDLQAKSRGEVVALLQRWTIIAARLTAGDTAASLDTPADQPAPDSGEALGIGPARLTLTFGFGAGLFERDGVDRFGLQTKRPEALVDLPRFNGDQMVEARCGGDLSVQACADDPQVAFHAVRQLARVADPAATIRWTQAGFSPAVGRATPRNLMGFRDGTSNPAVANDAAEKLAVWVGEEGPAWMRGGSYLVARRIRIALEHWDRMDLEYQEHTVGRRKYSGAPLNGTNELDTMNTEATDKDGNLVLPPTAHVRMGIASENGGALIHRRGFSFNDGVVFTAERWPPWHQGLAYDAGSLFICYQRDPRTGFIKLFDKMSKMDAMNQFTTHVGGGLFAIPAGIEQGTFVGQGLFDIA